MQAQCTVTETFDTLSADPAWFATGSYTRYHVLVIDAAGIVVHTVVGQAWTPLAQPDDADMNNVYIPPMPPGDYTVEVSTIPVAVGTRLADTDLSLTTFAHWGMDYRIDGCADGLLDTEGGVHTDVTGWYGTGYRTTWLADEVYTFPREDDVYVGIGGITQEILR